MSSTSDLPPRHRLASLPADTVTPHNGDLEDHNIINADPFKVNNDVI